MKRLLSILCAICLAWPLYAQELSNFANREQVVSPEIKEGKITFRLVAPEAKTVQLTGGFMPTKKVTYNNREMDVPVSRGHDEKRSGSMGVDDGLASTGSLYL